MTTDKTSIWLIDGEYLMFPGVNDDGDPRGTALKQEYGAVCVNTLNDSDAKMLWVKRHIQLLQQGVKPEDVTKYHKNILLLGKAEISGIYILRDMLP